MKLPYMLKQEEGEEAVGEDEEDREAEEETNEEETEEARNAINRGSPVLTVEEKGTRPLPVRVLRNPEEIDETKEGETAKGEIRKPLR